MGERKIMKIKEKLSVPIIILTLTTFLSAAVLPFPAYAQAVFLPKVGEMVRLSEHAYQPTLMRGVQIDPKHPMQLDFIFREGDDNLSPREFKAETTRMVKYFLATLTTPEKDLWVNLSPFEKNRIVPEKFGKTEMGRDLLAEDYILKQLSSSLIYPEDASGKAFWSKVYEEVALKTGSINVPMNAFNKVWVVPKDILIYENAKGALIVNGSLKVMLEEDLLAAGRLTKDQASGGKLAPSTEEALRQVIIPLIEREINEGKNFAILRQVYYALALATWYKKRLKESILGQIYMAKNKTAGITFRDAQDKEKIYQQYVRAYKKGVFNYIKEEENPLTKEMAPRKYFSGGKDFTNTVKVMRETRDPGLAPKDLAMKTHLVRFFLTAAAAGMALGSPKAAQAQIFSSSPGSSAYQINDGAGNTYFLQSLKPNEGLGYLVDQYGDQVGTFSTATYETNNITQSNNVVVTNYSYFREVLTIVPDDPNSPVVLANLILNDPLGNPEHLASPVYTISQAAYNNSPNTFINIIADNPNTKEGLISSLSHNGPHPGNLYGALSVSSGGVNIKFDETLSGLSTLNNWTVSAAPITLADNNTRIAEQSNLILGESYQLGPIVSQTPVNNIPGIAAYYQASLVGTEPGVTPPANVQSFGVITTDGKMIHLLLAEDTDTLANINYFRDAFAQVIPGDDLQALQRFTTLTKQNLSGPFSSTLLQTALGTTLDLNGQNPVILAQNTMTTTNQTSNFPMLFQGIAGVPTIASSTNFNNWLETKINAINRAYPGGQTAFWDIYTALNYRASLFQGQDGTDPVKAYIEYQVNQVFFYPLYSSSDIAAGVDIMTKGNGRTLLNSQIGGPDARILGLLAGWIKVKNVAVDYPGFVPEALIIQDLLAIGPRNTGVESDEAYATIDAMNNAEAESGVSRTEAHPAAKPKPFQKSIAIPGGAPKESLKKEEAVDYGGINFDPAQINMKIKFDGEMFHMAPATLSLYKGFKVDGLLPTMVRILPFNIERFLNQ